MVWNASAQPLDCDVRSMVTERRDNDGDRPKRHQVWVLARACWRSNAVDESHDGGAWVATSILNYHAGLQITGTRLPAHILVSTIMMAPA
jgi:hypothetical protein